jgi:hypothetical protein
VITSVILLVRERGSPGPVQPTGKRSMYHFLPYTMTIIVLDELEGG